MNFSNSPFIGIYLMGAFLNTVIFVFSYDMEGIAKVLCSTKVKKAIGIISIFFYVPFIIYMIQKYRGQNIG